MAIEKFLEAWKGAHSLTSYNNARSNSDRAQALTECFRQAGVKVENEVLLDYVALKMLRNGLVHHGWDEKDRAFLIARGFTPNVLELGQQHWKKIFTTAETLLRYLMLAAIASGWWLTEQENLIRRNVDGVSDFMIATWPRRASSMFVRAAGLTRVWWSNLERVFEQLPRVYRCDDGSVVIDTDDERDSEAIAELAEVALESWSAYLHAHPDLRSINLDDLRNATGTFVELEQEGIYSRASIGVAVRDLAFVVENNEEILTLVSEVSRPHVVRALTVARSMPADDPSPIWDLPLDEGTAANLLPLFLPSVNRARLPEIARALWLGARVFQGIRNSTPVDLFRDTLPVLDPEHREVYDKIGQLAEALLSLRMRWYKWVECVRRPAPV